MKQTKTDSLMEALTNVAVGFSINFVANVFILPAVLGVPVNLKELGFIGALYTVISVVRSYTLRRAFNGRTVWQAIKDRFTRQPDLAWDYIGRAQSARKRVQQLIERP